MEKTFKGAIYTLGAMFLASAIVFGMTVATPESLPLYDVGTGLLVALFCSSPLVMLVAIVSGIGSLLNRVQGRAKRKRDYDIVGFDDNDLMLDDIMQQLTPQQQTYLRHKLQNSRLGVGSDGEMISINELLNEYDEQEEQSGRL